MKSEAIEVTRLMEWWHVKIVCPVRSLWFTISARLSARQNGGGLLKLHGDVQSCGYEDVQVMWEMLQRSESGFLGAADHNNNNNINNPKRKHDHHHQQPAAAALCGVFIWSNIINHNPSSISFPKSSCFS